MSKMTVPFRRLFVEDDEKLFYETIEGLQGSMCIRMDRLYGDTFSLHFGQLVPNHGRGSGDRGEWIITAWGCDISGSDQQGQFRSQVDSDEEILARVSRVMGHRLTGIRLDTGTLSLRLCFSDGIEMDLSTDPGFDGDMWMISLPSLQTLGVNSDGNWWIENH